MATLLEILEATEAKSKAISMANKLFKPWEQSPDFLPELINHKLRQSGYRTFDTMDYIHMVKMPKNPNFIFDPSGEFFERYFGIDHLGEKIKIPGYYNENLVSIVIGKGHAENSAYILIASGAAGIHSRIKAVKGNEQVSVPILYASIKGHIEIILPNNLVYSR